MADNTEADLIARMNSIKDLFDNGNYAEAVSAHFMTFITYVIINQLTIRLLFAERTI